MTIFFSWRESHQDGEPNPDFADWKNRVFSYTWKGEKSRKAFWLFSDTVRYTPGPRLRKGRILIAFDFGAMDKTVIELPQNHIDFESTRFLGEAKHPSKIIVKANEPGAYGIGADIRTLLVVKSIRLATKKEINRTLGLNATAPQPTQVW